MSKLKLSNDTLVKIVIDTPMKKAYLRQVELLVAKETDKLVDTNYDPEAKVVSFGFVVQGRDALKAHFKSYMGMLGKIEVISTDKFTETENSFFFEATMRTTWGVAHVYDAFVLRNGKVLYHFTGVK